jgi:biopolymer transport protein ExbD
MAWRSFGGDPDEPMAEMNLIPLIDVSLTLLVIMMVTTVFIKAPGVSLRLPETVTREGKPETNKDLVISITQDGRLLMDGQKVNADGIHDRLKRVAEQDKQARVLVKGDRSVHYAQVMDVMDLVRRAGLTRVVLPTEAKSAGSQTGTR